jgi:hypothetical protein
MGWNLKRDAAEPAIVQALQAVGAEVWRLSGTGVGDILVRYRGVLHCAEVKTGKAKLRASQGAFPVWRTTEDALTAIGVFQDAKRTA